MAREVKVTVWCDRHIEKDERVEGEELPPFTMSPNRKPRVLALCKDCQAEIYNPLYELLATAGVAVTAPAPTGQLDLPVTTRTTATDREKCPVCDYEGAIKSLRNHAQTKHGKTLPELRGQSLDHKCPDCTESFASGQALSMHRRRAHQIATPAPKVKAKTA